MLATCRIALTLVFTLSGTTAAPPDDPGRLYQEAARLSSAGDPESAARAYARVHLLLRARNLHHSNVFDSAQETVGLTLAAHAGKANVPLLCEAATLLDDYKTALGSTGEAELVAEVTRLVEQIADALGRAGASCPRAPETTSEPPPQAEPLPAATAGPPQTIAPEGPKPAAPAPTPAPVDPRTRRLRIGGYTSLGVAALGVAALAAGAGAGAVRESAGRSAAMAGAEAGWLQDNIIGPGRTANAFVIAGAIVAGAATITAIALLASSRRQPRASARAQVTTFGLRF
ncbi:hypothetical protein [Nannocystis radixulma]|uniref:Uncharacterized protein n=1 Tax=Nannocystis radixulma TaxID=2995305 RepID=A0ABT5BH53_9BACT|nr:hypothetical protein [Nannocystis radixulma]MDC0673438.1 hypothetical protein [Nannocystis radixulma]